MFAYIKGLLANATTGHVTIETSGIGYKIFIPVSTFTSLPHIGSEMILYTSFVVREQAQTLYGFITSQERDFFEALIGVTGIGPKIALALIGHLPLSELQQAIAQSDTPTLCRVPGIGKKGAERLIIEMRDKVAVNSINPSDFAVHMYGDARAQTVNDAMSALINLGYNQMTAQKALKKTLKDIPEAIDLSSMISTALKHV